MVSDADQNEASPSLRAANCETDATFGGSWEEWCHTQARMRARRPSGMVSYADQNEASPSLKAASWEAERDGVMCKPEGLHVPWGCELRNCHHVRRLLGGLREWCHTQTKQNEASPSLGAANCETVATFMGPLGVQRSGVIRISE